MGTWRKAIVVMGVTAVALLLLWWIVTAYGARGVISAFLINWLAMSWAAIAGQAVRFRLPQEHYRLRAFEQDGRIYECLGVRLFKMLVRHGPLAILSPTLRMPAQRTVPALRALEGEMETTEAAHMIVFILMTLAALAALLKGWLDASLWVMVFNILLNGYPVLLQRYNRVLLRALIATQG